MHGSLSSFNTLSSYTSQPSNGYDSDSDNDSDNDDFDDFDK